MTNEQAPKLPEKSAKVKVFTDEELEKIVAACDTYPQRNAWGHDNRARVKALVLTLRYSGMRIGDVVSLQKAHLKGDKLFLNTQKSGSKATRSCHRPSCGTIRGCSSFRKPGSACTAPRTSIAEKTEAIVRRVFVPTAMTSPCQECCARSHAWGGPGIVGMSGRLLRELRTTLDGEHIGVRTRERGTTAALAERETFPRRTHERPPKWGGRSCVLSRTATAARRRSARRRLSRRQRQ